MAGHGARISISRGDQVEGLEIDEDLLGKLADLTTNDAAVVDALRNSLKVWYVIQYQISENVPWADAEAFVMQHSTDVH